MIERSKLNEMLSDMTPNKMLLEVSVSPNFVFFKNNKILILIRLRTKHVFKHFYWMFDL